MLNTNNTTLITPTTIILVDRFIVYVYVFECVFESVCGRVYVMYVLWKIF